jgi:heme b synthase
LDCAVPAPRLIAWEITRSCNLRCAHCRGSAVEGDYSGELSTGECFSLVDSVLEVGKPIIILTGGEPLLRGDFFEIANYCSSRGLRVTVGSNGTLLTREMAAKMKDVPIARVGISIDFPTAEKQDTFRGVPGAFEAAVDGIKNAIGAGLEVQINTTVTTLNVACLDDLLKLALEVGAVAMHPFLLVPTGRGKDLEAQELPPEEYEHVLHWVYDKQAELGSRLFLKPTDAPHYMRVVLQRGEGSRAVEGGSAGSMNALTRGCLAGTGFCFISHLGRVQGCGYLDVEAGNVRRQTFADIWQTSPLFNELRDYSNIKGKCGICDYRIVCGGCRARAYEDTGDYLAEEPYCVYRPVAPASILRRVEGTG